ncbi:cell envelope biogenesis protein TolA [Flavisphingomonas formosensis]|uniref:cell envelope biogenesis protein TolA n=1 Tax=Flavisphingomonas formosensis TaxID=861534 RepID=UPI0012FC15FA|nr:cell envelope biogenesis protein TolA [Sphingomonas formosensis]
MDRAERNGLGIAIVAHALLLAALSIKLMPSAKIPLKSDPMEVQLVGEIGLQSAAPKSEAPAQSAAREVAKPEESAPPPEPAPPQPAPPKPQPPKPEPKPVPPKPEPKPTPPKPTPPKAEPKPKPEPPRPEPKPTPKPVPPKPAPPKKEAEKPAKEAPEKPSKAKPTPDKAAAPAKAAPDKSAPAKPAPATSPKGEGSKAGKKTSGLTLDDIMKGVKPEKSPGKAQTPQGAKLDARSIAGLASAIAAQVKPCYQIPTGGAGSERIVSVLDLRMGRDGSVSSASVVGHLGVTPDNQPYVQQMDDAAKRAVLRCAPLHLPADLYDVGDGNGWNHIQFKFTPAQMN